MKNFLFRLSGDIYLAVCVGAAFHFFGFYAAILVFLACLGGFIDGWYTYARKLGHD